MDLVLLLWGIMKALFWCVLAIFFIVVFVLGLRLYVTEKKPLKPTKEVTELRERVAAELKERRGGYR